MVHAPSPSNNCLKPGVAEAFRNAQKLTTQPTPSTLCFLRDPFQCFRFHNLRRQAITAMAEAGASDATIMAVFD